MLAARVREKEAVSQLRELELEHESGLFVKRSEVEAAGRQIGESVRTALLAIPQRVALQVEATLARDPALRAPQIEALIADEINQVLTVLHGTVYTAG